MIIHASGSTPASWLALADLLAGADVTLDDEVLDRSPPHRRIAEPSEIADVVLWLSSSKSSFVTGVALPVDVGFTAQ